MEVSFADWFRDTRTRKGLTQIAAAEELRLTGPTLSRWESGGQPASEHLDRVRTWGRISADRLLKIVSRKAA